MEDEHGDIKTEYVSEIYKLLIICNDLLLLDFIFKLLQKTPLRQ